VEGHRGGAESLREPENQAKISQFKELPRPHEI
jgi:hypothetical protein